MATEQATRRHHPLSAVWKQAEPLWPASLALLIIVPGHQLGSAIIQFFGRGGRRETVEWLTYLVVLAALPLGAFLIARILPRATSPRVQTIVKIGLLFFVVLECVVYLAGSQWRAVGAAALMSVITVGSVTGVTDSNHPSPGNRPGPIGWIVPIIVGTAAWMSAGSLVSWSDATSWFLATPVRLVIFALAFAVSVLAMRATFRSYPNPGPGTVAKLFTFVGVMILLALSFRTNPVLEFYHWTFYVGPMQQLRQGAWLLWDAPSQYGVLSVFIPTLFPGNAWQSFYLFQALCNAVVALLMFRVLAGRQSSIQIMFATVLTAAMLFFRLREGPVLLAAQMTPSGGPVRFIGPFVMLAFVFRYYRMAARRGERDERADSQFEIWGHIIWLGSICWSVETGIYCSGVWFPAYALFLMQRASDERRSGRGRTEIARGLLRSIALPIGALLSTIVIVSVVYRPTLGHFPDWMAYFEYALLYSGGFHSLEIDPSGSVWYLLMIFLAILTATVTLVFMDPRNPRAIVLAGACGGVWAMSSYFVSRSHPANLLSIATFLVFAAAITLRIVADQPPESWHGLLRVAILPLFVTPVALTIGHPSFVRQITTPQLSYAAFTEQIPLMEPSLNELLLEAGAKPTDPVVRIGDARLMLPAWRTREPHGAKVVSPYSWLPKPFEVIATLPPQRRQKYIDRLAHDLPSSGWLIHTQAGGIRNFPEQLSDIRRTHVETKRFENTDWIVSWYQLKQ